jgi:hypothetical protein
MYCHCPRFRTGIDQLTDSLTWDKQELDLDFWWDNFLESGHQTDQEDREELLPPLPRYCPSLPVVHFGITLDTIPLKMVNKAIRMERTTILKIVT